MFLYKISSLPTPGVILKNIFICSLKRDVDIYKDLPTDVMQPVGSTLYCSIAGRVQKEITFLALGTMKTKIINGMSAGMLSGLQEPSWLPSPPSSRCGSASCSTTNLAQA